MAILSCVLGFLRFHNLSETAGAENALRDWGGSPGARKWNQYIASAMKLIETDDQIALHAQQQVPLVAVHPDSSVTVSADISTYH